MLEVSEGAAPPGVVFTSFCHRQEGLPVLTAAEDAEDQQVVGFDAIDDYVLAARVNADRWIELPSLARDLWHRHERVEGVLECVRVEVGLLDRPVAGGVEPDVFEISLGCGGQAVMVEFTSRHAARASAP